MKQIVTIAELRQARKSLLAEVGLVPTMGALHDGHLSLIETARRENDYVIVTIFINPKQFAPHEDLEGYPRDIEGDLAKLQKAGVDLVFLPSPLVMYPEGFRTYVTVKEITLRLEGERRPEHFRGVTTVVSKLFNLAQPDRAYFGQKDAQQVVVLRQMVKDLNFPVEIVVCPTIREADGLAMSSRNVYLNAKERESAARLFHALQEAGQAYEKGERDPELLRTIALEVLNSDEIIRTDYVSIVDPSTFGAVIYQDDPMLILVAAQIGRPRLLDNCLLPWGLNTQEGLSTILGTN
jgi:pantoate--beta-alanine ligase